MVYLGRAMALICCAALLAGCTSDERPKTKGPGLRVGHAGSTLTESIGVETIGGAFTPLIKKGTEIPVTIKEVFSTAADNQPAVDIHVLAGNGEMAKENRTIGRFQLYGIPPAPRAVPQIEVCFVIDREGIVTINARDLATGKENEIRILGVKTEAQEKE